MEGLLEIKPSGHAIILTEACNLIDEFFEKREIENKRQYRKAPDELHTIPMKVPGKLLEQIVFKKGPKIEEQMLIVMDKSTPEELLSQHLQTSSKQHKIAVTFLTVYNGAFNVKKPKPNFYFAKSFTDKYGFIQRTIPQGAYKLESLNDEIKRITIKEGHFAEVDYPFTIKPHFSSLGCIIEVSRQDPIIGFIPFDSIRDLLGFNAGPVYEE